MELSTIAALPLMFSSRFSAESVIKYFCVQALASSFLLLFGLVYFSWADIYWGVLRALVLKLGMFPGHF